jgi:hypothetical protein
MTRRQCPHRMVRGWHGRLHGDGMADIVWRDTAGDAGIWLMNGATVLSAVGLGSVPTTWSIVTNGRLQWRWHERLTVARRRRRHRHVDHERNDGRVGGGGRKHFNELDGAVGQRRVKKGSSREDILARCGR